MDTARIEIVNMGSVLGSFLFPDHGIPVNLLVKVTYEGLLADSGLTKDE
jgi:hypothetical protein